MTSTVKVNVLMHGA